MSNEEDIGIGEGDKPSATDNRDLSGVTCTQVQQPKSMKIVVEAFNTCHNLHGTQLSFRQL